MSEHDLLSDEGKQRKLPWSIVIPVAIAAALLIHVTFDAGVQYAMGSCVPVDSQAQLCLLPTTTVE